MKILQVDDFVHRIVKLKALKREMSIKDYIQYLVELDTEIVITIKQIKGKENE